MVTGQVVTIPFGMLVKKYYCIRCGCKLKRKKVEQIFFSEDEGYKEARDEVIKMFSRRNRIMVPFKGEIKITHYVFQCPDCGKMVSYELQKEFAKTQKKTKSKILLTS